jgi:hypothetical protein
MKQLSYLLKAFLISLTLVFTSCDKDDDASNNNSENCTMDCCPNEGMQMRMAMQEDGYTEVEVNPIEKIECYFEEWDKTLMTPVSGLFEYYDQNEIWVASIDFGNGECDQWATKTWDVNIFPDYPEGSLEFSLFE